MAAFLTATEDSQREVNHFAYEQEKRPPRQSIVLSAFIAVGNFVGIHRATAAMMMIP